MFSDREEGEIDSEEDCLRRRISELEAENAEYEKMRISVVYNDGCSNDLLTYENFNNWELQRAGRVPTDVSSISSVEFPSPKKRKRKRSKKDSTKVHAKRFESSHHCRSQWRHRRDKTLRSNCQRNNSSRHVLTDNVNKEIETILLDSSDSGDYEKDNYSIATMDLESEEDNNDVSLPLSREELRLALAHSTNDNTKIKVCPLKERLQKENVNIKNSRDENQMCHDSIENKSVPNSFKTSPEVISDNSMSLEEQELRLIALRSAIMKKHLTRKKRNAEVAYSPTDFEQLVDPISSIETDLEELEKDMDISPVSSPNLLLSPIQYEDDHISIISLDSLANRNRPIDMDIATSESENEGNVLNIFDSVNKFLPHNDIPLPPAPILSDSNISMVYNYTNQSTTNAFEKSTLGVNLNTCTAPATRTHSLQLSNPSEKGYSREQENITEPFKENSVPHFGDNKMEKLVSYSCTPSDTKLPGLNVPVSIQSQSEFDQASDEEEKALRALLLSQRQNVKSSKQAHKARNHSPHLCSFASQSSEKDQKLLKLPNNSNPTESILKEAVRRLQVATVTKDNSFLKEESKLIIQNAKLVALKNRTQPQMDENYYSNKNGFAEEQKCYHKSADKDKNSTQILRAKKLELNCNKNTVEKGNIYKKSLESNYRSDIKASCVSEMVKMDSSQEFKGAQNEPLTSKTIDVKTTKHLKNNMESITMENKTIENHLKSSSAKPNICKVDTGVEDLKTNQNSTPRKLNDNLQLTHQHRIANLVKSSLSTAIDLLKVEKRPTHSVKIIKPNKIINTNASVELKRKVLLNNNPFLRKTDLLGKKSNVIHGSRLISSINMSDIKVNKLIISLNNSESSNDEDVLHNEHLEKSVHQDTERTDTPDSLVNLLNENIYNISDISNTPTEGNCESQGKINQVPKISSKEYEKRDSFEKKLDIFLKTVRSTVQQENTVERPVMQRKSGCNETTPTAVRSLPIASQEEYKRLIHRMKLLEKQKQLRKFHKENCNDGKIITTTSKNNKELSNICKTTSKSIIQTESEAVFGTEEIGSNIDVASREQELLTSEASFRNISNCIILNLDKSLQLVSKVKRAKMAKMRCAQRLKELRLEMDNTQRKLKEEQDKISTIYPQICSTNELITKLKQKSAHVFESTVKLGKSFKGNDYRLNNDLKKEITLKTKGLATNIKLVNSIKYCDLDMFEKELKVSANKPSCDLHKYNPLGSPGCSENAKIIHATEKGERCCSKNTPDSEFADRNATDEFENVVDEMARHKSASTKLDLQNETNQDSNVENPQRNVKDKEDCKETKIIKCKGNSDAFKEGRILYKYESPLIHFRTESGQWDPNGIVCPYELMGQCEDKDCSYLHLCWKNTSLNEILK